MYDQDFIRDMEDAAENRERAKGDRMRRKHRERVDAVIATGRFATRKEVHDYLVSIGRPPTCTRTLEALARPA